MCYIMLVGGVFTHLKKNSLISAATYSASYTMQPRTLQGVSIFQWDFFSAWMTLLLCVTLSCCVPLSAHKLICQHIVMCQV